MLTIKIPKISEEFNEKCGKRSVIRNKKGDRLLFL
jgi:hypothetical protein